MQGYISVHHRPDLMASIGRVVSPVIITSSYNGVQPANPKGASSKSARTRIVYMARLNNRIA